MDAASKLLVFVFPGLEHLEGISFRGFIGIRLHRAFPITWSLELMGHANGSSANERLVLDVDCCARESFPAPV